MKKRLKAKFALVIYKRLTKAEEKCNKFKEAFYKADSLSNEKEKMKIKKKCWYGFKKNRSIIKNLQYQKIIYNLPDSFDEFKNDVRRMIQNVESF